MPLVLSDIFFRLKLYESNQKPDFHGIEIKAFRKRSIGKLVTLFSQVPNWKKSNTNRSEVLNEYGYLDANERFNLYCSVFGHEKNISILFFLAYRKTFNQFFSVKLLL